MNSRMWRVLRGPVIVAGLLAAGVALVPLTASAANVALLDNDKATSAPATGLTACNGGVQKSALVMMDDTPTTLAENAAFVTLPGATIVFNTPANDSDQVLVTFSAEARLLGQALTYVVPADFLQLQVLLDGVPMLPDNDLTFTTDTGHANATQTCKRMPAAPVVVAHTVTVQWLIVDQGANNALTGTLDDWALHVEINN
jgi:hypothetical protein